VSQEFSLDIPHDFYGVVGVLRGEVCDSQPHSILGMSHLFVKRDKTRFLVRGSRRPSHIPVGDVEHFKVARISALEFCPYFVSFVDSVRDLDKLAIKTLITSEGADLAKGTQESSPQHSVRRSKSDSKMG